MASRDYQQRTAFCTGYKVSLHYKCYRIMVNVPLEKADSKYQHGTGKYWTGYWKWNCTQRTANVENYSLLRYDSVWFGMFVPKSWRNLMSPFSG